MIKRASVLAAATFMPLALWADTGKTTAEFLKLGAGARAGALGGAYSSIADEPSALYWNPASLTMVKGAHAATLMHAVYIESTFFDYLAYSHKMGDTGTLGFGAQYFSAGNITKTDITGSEAGTFTPSDMALSIGYGRRLEALGDYALGLTAKFIQSKIIDSAQTGALDLGVLSPAYGDDRFRFALSAANIGGKIKFTKAEEDLPLLIRVGAGLKLNEKWLAAVEGEAPLDDKFAVSLGTEYVYPLPKERGLAGRLGVNTRTMGEVEGFTGFAYGLGFKDPRFCLDYSIEPLGDLGLSHRLSLSLSF